MFWIRYKHMSRYWSFILFPPLLITACLNGQGVKFHM